jgi:hypothetical protein
MSSEGMSSRTGTVFDLSASALAAELWIRHRGLSKHEQMQRVPLKLDVMVLATAKTAGARLFYSNDRKCRALAKSIGLDARDLPTHSESLLTQAETMFGKKL